MDKHTLGYTLRVRLTRDEVFYGPGVHELLRRVERSGSLQTAAAEMDMSYSKAWKVVRKAEQELGFALLARRVGGTGGGSSLLTARGGDFLTRYERFAERVQACAERLFAEAFDEKNETGETDETD